MKIKATLINAVIIMILGAACVLAYVCFSNGYWIIGSLIVLALVAYVAINIWGLLMALRFKKMVGPGGPLSVEAHERRLLEAGFYDDPIS